MAQRSLAGLLYLAVFLLRPMARASAASATPNAADTLGVQLAVGNRGLQKAEGIALSFLSKLPAIRYIYQQAHIGTPVHPLPSTNTTCMMVSLHPSHPRCAVRTHHSYPRLPLSPLVLTPIHPPPPPVHPYTRTPLPCKPYPTASPRSASRRRGTRSSSATSPATSLLSRAPNSPSAAARSTCLRPGSPQSARWTGR